MSRTVLDDQLADLEDRYSESIEYALARHDHTAAATLGAAYDKKAARLIALRDGPAPCSPMARLVQRLSKPRAA